MILAGDIGATESLLGIFEKGKSDSVFKADRFNKDYSNLIEMLKAFLQQAKLKEPIYAICIGISGFVENGRGKIVDGWEITERDLCELLIEHWGITDTSYSDALLKKRVGKIVNSLAAIDSKTLEKSGNEVVDLNPSSDASSSSGGELPHNHAWITVRSGLAEALLYWDQHEKDFILSSSEGGHANFAPRNELEDELLGYLRGRFGSPVSYQQVLSQNGLVYIYQFLRGKNSKYEEPTILPGLTKEDDENFAIAVDEIIHTALTKENFLCADTLDLFVSAFGAEAGNLALKYYALGGIYVGGDIALKIVDKLRDGTFMQAFTDRKQQEIANITKSIPVKLVKNPDIKFLGIARCALRKERIGQELHSRAHD